MSFKVYFLAATAAPPATAAVRNGPPPVEAGVGTSLKGRVPGVDWSANGRTLVLAISSTCHFCKDSEPFYRKLRQELGKGIKMVAVLPQPVTEAEQYLKNDGVAVDQVKQVSMGALGVRGTPTMLLVDKGGMVTKVWTGRLQPEQEEQVLSFLRKG
jgi:thioredoxin-related protein